jgi:hypothetical protein
MSLFLRNNFNLLLCFLAFLWALPAVTSAKHGIHSVSNTDYASTPFNRPNAQESVSAGAADDNQALLLQKCLELTELQPYYPKNTDGTYQPLRVLQHGISFPTDLKVSVGNKPVVFVEKAQIAADQVEAYFLFYAFTIGEKSAKVDFVFNYDQTSSLKKMQVVSLELQKAGSSWTIVQTKIEGREL